MCDPPFSHFFNWNRWQYIRNSLNIFANSGCAFTPRCFLLIICHFLFFKLKSMNSWKSFGIRVFTKLFYHRPQTYNISYPSTIWLPCPFVYQEIAGHVTFLFAKLTISSWKVLLFVVLGLLWFNRFWCARAMASFGYRFALILPSITPAIYSRLLSLI